MVFLIRICDYSCLNIIKQSWETLCSQLTIPIMTQYGKCNKDLQNDLILSHFPKGGKIMHQKILFECSIGILSTQITLSRQIYSTISGYIIVDGE